MNFYLTLSAVFVYFFITNIHLSVAEERVITAINDNGCAKPTTIEIKPAKYNLWPNLK
jgi:hypothetical protein